METGAAHGELSCVPRAGAIAGMNSAGDGGCDITCSKPAGPLGDSFAALTSEIDYSRFCSAACRPIGSTRNMLCATMKDATEYAMMQLRQTQTDEPEETNTEEDQDYAAGSQTAIMLAKGALLRAELHAKEAQESAALSKLAYEKLVESRKVAADAAGQAALEKAIAEVKEDSASAAALRAGWEEKARDVAVHKALGAATVYKMAKDKAMRTADDWEKNAEELTKVTKKYEDYAEDLANQQSQLEKDVTEYKEAPADLLSQLQTVQNKASQALKAAQRYGEQAQNAAAQATAIRANSSWYDEAETQAAQHALLTSLPEGVAVPPLPPLP
jgi:hypothetical protein